MNNNLTLKTPTIPMYNSVKGWSVSLQYTFIDQIFYLYVMSYWSYIKSIIIVIIFSDHSFKNLHLIAFVDCITCLLVFIYCISNYTRPHTLNDKYFRIWYLDSVYIPLANITAACNVLLTITVIIERLISIRWPLEKQCLFSFNRVLIKLVICFLFPFLVYKVGEIFWFL
ncbi:unnamed protein product [Rotaria socialis]|uniref:G-protein coupled receptors family 1 profile domain-containing protein n=1 Tax=Rotaria socialis TaxID=392032 RepID=A0A817SGC3_9BILA|nr:unnamed protein product [Rotaria socialis]CAF3382345.1 unnamed protein product [Rotaria socialis]CAF3580518.1 unnamed protein product [Rotaria socialis]CAF4481530.1 unnamed protein product [Rotaria socialis]CAF4556920.1 unnamed protein product [Rotaria socialis]